MANCSPHCASTCPLPADLRTIMSHALTCKSFTAGAGAHQAGNIEGCCRAMMSALDSDSGIYLDLDDIRSLLDQGHLSLGYGQSPAGEEDIVKACKASAQGLLTENPGLLQTATGILIILQTPQHATIKLGAVREGLREIWQHGPDSAQCLYSCIAGEAATGQHEVYTLVVNDKRSKASDPQLAIDPYLTLDEALQKVAQLQNQTDTDVTLLQHACRILAKHQRSSASYMQRKLKIGHSRASNLIKQLELAGISRSIAPDVIKPALVRF